MNTAQTRNTHLTSDIAPIVFPPYVAIAEGIYLAEILALESARAWLQAVEEGMKVEHDLLMAMLGYRPHEHVAPWENLNGQAWFEALDKGLAAAGE